MSEKDTKKEKVEEKDIATKATKNASEEQNTDSTDKENTETKEDNKKKKAKKNSKEEQIEELGVKLQEVNDKYMRLSAEFDNYRKRTLKEKMELTKTAGEKILVNILPVVDNFERAIKSVEQTSDVEAVKEGIIHIYKNLGEFLKQNGITEIDATNVDFDTDLHEALTKIPAASDELKGKVVDCVEKGYKLNDKVIRYAKVVVGE